MAFQLAKAYVEFSQKGMTKVQRGVSGLGRTIGRLINPVGLVSAGIGALGGAAAVGGMLKLAADAESLETSFRTLLGSAEDAKDMMEEINQFASSTPYEQLNLAGVAKQLLGYGEAQEDVIGVMRQLGDVASGSGSQLEDLTRIYGKVKGTGRLMTESLDQFLERGIPIGAELARMFGVTEAEIRKMASSGEIGFEHMQTALSNLTAEGGLYFGGMAAQSKTLGGLWSTLTGNMKILFGEIGQLLVEAFDVKSIIGDLGSFVGNFRQNYGEQLKAVFGSVAEVSRQVWQWIAGHVAGFVSIFQGYSDTILNIWGEVQENTRVIGDFLRSLGDLFMELGKMAVRGLAMVVDAFAGGEESAYHTFVSVQRGWLAMITGWIDDITSVLKNWSIYSALVGEYVYLGISNAWNITSTFFSNMGRILLWAASNWREVFATVGDRVTILFDNLIHNITEAWNALWAMIQGRDYKADFRGITEGFASTLSSLPELATASIATSNAAIDRLYRQLAESQRDREQEAETVTAADDSPAKKRGDVRTAAGSASAMMAGRAGGKASGGLAAGRHIGLAELAKQMQQAALNQASERQKMRLAQEQARDTKRMADAIAGGGQGGGGLKVQIVNQEALAPTW